MPSKVDGGSEGETFKGLRERDVLEAFFLTFKDGHGFTCPICPSGRLKLEALKNHLELRHHLTPLGTLEAKKELIRFERNIQASRLFLAGFGMIFLGFVGSVGAIMYLWVWPTLRALGYSI